LSHKSGQDAAQKFLATIEKIKLPIIHINELLQRETLDFFKKQEKKGTSVVDCSNVVVMRRFQIPTILSFDGFYTKQSDIKTI
jgi:predicted nucleic acid-binding protein